MVKKRAGMPRKGLEDKYMNTNITKAVVVAVLSTFFSGCWALIVPAVVLLLCEVVDYITGVNAAKDRGQEVKSEKSYAGIRKKISMFGLVFVGAVVDLLLLYCSSIMGVQLPEMCNFMFSCVICLWLICNEIISITENLRDMGAPIPIFLIPVLKLIRTKVEETVVVDSEENEDREKE